MRLHYHTYHSYPIAFTRAPRPFALPQPASFTTPTPLHYHRCLIHSAPTPPHHVHYHIYTVSLPHVPLALPHIPRTLPQAPLILPQRPLPLPHWPRSVTTDAIYITTLTPAHYHRCHFHYHSYPAPLLQLPFHYHIYPASLPQAPLGYHNYPAPLPHLPPPLPRVPNPLPRLPRSMAITPAALIHCHTFHMPCCLLYYDGVRQ